MAYVLNIPPIVNEGTTAEWANKRTRRDSTTLYVDLHIQIFDDSTSTVIAEETFQANANTDHPDAYEIIKNK